MSNKEAEQKNTEREGVPEMGRAGKYVGFFKFFLTETDVAIFEKFRTSEIYKDDETVLREALITLFRKYFPTHTQSQKIRKYLKRVMGMEEAEKQLSPEERCLADGGEVSELDGVRVCVTKKGAMRFTNPL